MVLFYCMLVVPAVSWSLVAETVRGRIAGAAVLAGLAVIEWVLAHGWLGHEYQWTALAVLGVLVVAVLLVAPVVEAMVADDDAEPAGLAKARIIIGRILTFGYGVVSGLLLVAAVTLVPALGRWAWVPAADAILPLPDGLALISTRGEGCSGAKNSCLREFVIGNTAGTPEESAARVLFFLHDTYGWSFTPAISGGDRHDHWTSDCPMQGWGLDVHTACTSVSLRDDMVYVRLRYEDDW